MADVVSLGEFLIDMVSTQRNVTLFDAPAFEPKPGGAPANVAVGVARLGKQVAFVGKIGKDEFGIGLRGLLQKEGIDTHNLLDDDHVLTTLALVSLSDTGNPSFAIFAGAHTQLKTSDLDQELITTSKIFHFSSITLAHEPVRQTTHDAVQLAKSHGVIVSYDVNFRPALYPDRAEGIERIKAPIPYVDLLKMNESELKLITGESDPQRGLEVLDAPAPLVVITMAEKGCLYRVGGKGGSIHAQSTAPVDHVVDATGAGDSFMAAILAGLCDGFNLDLDYLARLTKRACQAGAIATSKRGAIPSLPYLNQLDPL